MTLDSIRSDSGTRAQSSCAQSQDPPPPRRHPADGDDRPFAAAPAGVDPATARRM